MAGVRRHDPAAAGSTACSTRATRARPSPSTAATCAGSVAELAVRMEGVRPAFAPRARWVHRDPGGGPRPRRPLDRRARRPRLRARPARRGRLDPRRPRRAGLLRGHGGVPGRRGPPGRRPDAAVPADAARTGPIPGDVVASAFYLLARWDELRVAARDRFGRLPLADSAFGRIAGLDLEDPPVEGYIALLRRLLGIPAPAGWSVALTHDIDRIRRRTAKGLAVHRPPPRAAGRRRARRWARTPGTTSRTCWRPSGVRGVRSTVFLIGRNAHPPGRHAAPRPTSASAARWRRRCAPPAARWACTGRSPRPRTGPRWPPSSPACGPRPGCPCAGVRFHYLRFRYHETVRWLEAAGARYDSSLAFSEAPGFAAGIARPFRPWIVGEERPADLTLLPLAVMDTTLHSRLGLDAEAARRARAAGARPRARGRRPGRPAVAQHLPRRRPRARLRRRCGATCSTRSPPAARALGPGRRPGGARRRRPTCAGGGWST